MNLAKLFEMQRKLDAHIEKEHPRQPGEDRLAKKILALQVELGELANEARFFKYWSNDQEPRTEIPIDCPYCYGKGYMNHDEVFEGGEPWPCKRCDGSGVYGYKNALIEEYADGLHFILSIGLELNIPVIYGTETKWDELTSDETDITQQFLLVFENVNKLVHPIDWINLFEEFYILGKMLGFTWDQIEEAYMKKNAKNHRRQDSGVY
ncbi:dUTP diphosphatase [Bacillus sp. FSL W8-0223]|uniref:dUTP diphosphatase n=1 Tax=Bacillus sp. FSL W8-0223 TaxID=2954595 RepID=UPI0030F9CC67